MIDSAEDYVEEEDRQLFEELKNAETRRYRASSEDNMLSKDLTRRKEDKDYEITTSGNSISSQQKSSQSSQNGPDVDA